jgi:formiminoglutamase
MKHLKLYNKQDILSLTRLRRFETRLGERLQVLADTSNVEASIEKSPANYVLFGIPEDIGHKSQPGSGRRGYLLDTFSAIISKYSE